MQFPKKMPDMPKGNWKASFAFSPTLTVKLSTKELKPRGGTAKPQEKAKPKKPIAKISEKKKKRIKEQGSEIDLFREIITDRGELYCEVCGKHIKNPKPHHFDHKIPKSRWEKYRLDKNNIQILCFADHFEKTTWLKYKGINLD